MKKLVSITLLLFISQFASAYSEAQAEGEKAYRCATAAKIAINSFKHSATDPQKRMTMSLLTGKLARENKNSRVQSMYPSEAELMGAVVMFEVALETAGKRTQLSQEDREYFTGVSAAGCAITSYQFEDMN